MRINCPICGLRDLREFHYLGSDRLLARPMPVDIADPSNAGDQDAFYDYVYLRDNPEGPNGELWSHEYGCRAWLRVVRDTKTHIISSIELARDAKEAK